MTSKGVGVAYFNCENCSFLLQNFYQKELADNFVMHLLVEDIYACHEKLKDSCVTETYGVLLSEVVEQPWRMLDFMLSDPSGVQ